MTSLPPEKKVRENCEVFTRMNEFITLYVVEVVTMILCIKFLIPFHFQGIQLSSYSMPYVLHISDHSFWSFLPNQK